MCHIRKCMKFLKEKSIWEALPATKGSWPHPRRPQLRCQKQKVPVPVPPISKTAHKLLSVLFRTTKSFQNEIYLKKISVTQSLINSITYPIFSSNSLFQQWSVWWTIPLYNLTDFWNNFYDITLFDGFWLIYNSGAVIWHFDKDLAYSYD